MTTAPEGDGRPGDTEVVAAGPDRVPELAVLLGRAFADDPMIMWPLRPGAGEVEVRRMFEILDVPFARMGALFEVGPSLGVAAWMAPNQIEAYVEIDAQTRPLVAALTDDGGARYAALWDWVESHIPDEPLWFLDQVAVDAIARGRGLGAALHHPRPLPSSCRGRSGVPRDRPAGERRLLRAARISPPRGGRCSRRRPAHLVPARGPGRERRLARR